MPRLKRLFVEGQPLHVIQRGVDRQAVFFADEDRKLYCQWLAEAASACGTIVHAWVLMTNHVHLLVTPCTPDSLPGTMQMLGRRYVRYINFMSGRTGPLWEGRYRSAPVDSEDYFLACCRYIELNPVRARMVAHPDDYRWSSYRAHAHGAADPLTCTHEHYEALGADAAARQAGYRELFRHELDEDFLSALRRATHGGWALGGERFLKQIEIVAQRRAAPLPRGRKAREEEMGSG
jgi:putative transposase